MASTELVYIEAPVHMHKLWTSWEKPSYLNVTQACVHSLD